MSEPLSRFTARRFAFFLAGALKIHFSRKLNNARGRFLAACERLLMGFAYQLAFLTPGIWPLYASSRKQIRQMP